MKTLINTALPALALLALGGCATTGAISSTEPDDVYFSSKDKVTYAAPAAGTSYQSSGYQPNGYGSASTQAQTPAPAGENANPDYQGGTAQTGTSTDYYDDNYTSYNSVQPSGFGQPYTGPGVSTYNYTPSWSVAPAVYASPFGYGTGLSIGYGYGGFGGYSPFGYGYGYPAYAGFYDPFYSPFYSPWGFGYGSGLSIGFGYGFGGYGGFGYPYYGGFGSPYRYGYGYPGYAYGGGYGGGYYDGYGYGRGGARNYVYKQGIMNGSYSNGYDPGAIKVGRRESRYADAAGSSGVVAPGGASGAGQFSNRRAASGATSGFDRAVAPGGAVPATSSMTAPNQPAAAAFERRRFDQNTMNPNSPGATGAYNQPRMAEAANPGAPQPQRRGGFFREMFANPNPGQAQGQNNGYAQPQQRNFDQQRAFSQPQPRMEQRSFQQPQQRSFEQPRMEQRSFSPAPSFGGGGGGGGFGGGGGGRRGR